MALLIHVFHGFLGSPENFNFLISPDVILHDLYSENLKNITANISSEDTLIGYSMGGRIAMNIASEKEFHIRKLVLINAHPGLSSEAERAEREKWETMVLEKLRGSSSEFLSWWNSLKVFAADEPLTTLSDGKKAKSEELFDLFRLSRQPDYLPELREHKDKVLWIIGSLDSKYAEIAENTLVPMGVKCRFIKGGHRLFQQGESLKNVLKEENIL